MSLMSFQLSFGMTHRWEGEPEQQKGGKGERRRERREKREEEGGNGGDRGGRGRGKGGVRRIDRRTMGCFLMSSGPGFWPT